MKSSIRFLIILIIFISFCKASTSELASRNMKLIFNGHEYLQHDPISESIAYNYEESVYQLEDRIEAGFENVSGIYLDSYTVLPELESINFSVNTQTNTGRMDVTTGMITINFHTNNCDELRADFKINISADMITEITEEQGPVVVKFQTQNLYIAANDFGVTNVDEYEWYQVILEWWCNQVSYAFNGFEGIAEWYLNYQYIQDFSHELFSLDAVSENPGADIADYQTLWDSFPLDISISGDADGQLVIALDFMEGTAQNPSQFVGVQPDPVPTDHTLEYLGFGAQDNSFDDITDPSAPSPPQQVEEMVNMGIPSFRYAINWGNISGVLPNEGLLTLSPDDITDANLDALVDEYLNEHAAAITELNSHLTVVQDNKMDLILMLGYGASDHTPKMMYNGTAYKIAPNSTSHGDIIPGVKATEAYSVPPDFYLYHLKLHAHAMGRYFADVVPLWFIEGELEVSQFAQTFHYWRDGDMWSDPAFREQVWDIIVNAVRTEDPSAKLSSEMHMLDIVNSIQTHGPDLDYIGCNFYPNQLFAIPNLGNMVGEYVWAVRRVLKGLGMEDKGVIITETGYPGDPEIGNNLDVPYDLNANKNFFSYQRQQEYLDLALESSVANGLDGFFWFTFWNSNGLESGGIRNPQNSFYTPEGGFKQNVKSSYEQAVVNPNYYPGRALVTLTTRDETGTDIPEGKLSVVGKRHNMSSGESYRFLKGREYDSQVEYINLSHNNENKGLNNWDLGSQHLLKESFTINLEENEKSRIAYYYPLKTTNITANNEHVEIEFHDPWYVENPDADSENWIQPDEFRPLSEITTDGSYPVFLNQGNINDPSDPTPIYHLQAPLFTDAGNGDYYLFDHWGGDDVLYGVGQTTTTANETPVVFTAENASPTPSFNHLSVAGTASVRMAGEDIMISAPKFQANQTSIYEFSSWSGSNVTFATQNSRETTITLLGSESAIEAQYVRVDTVPNYSIDVSEGMTLEIPDGAEYNFAEGVKLEVAGTLNAGIMGGITGERCLFTSATTWRGIVATGVDAVISLHYSTIENAVNADYTSGGYPETSVFKVSGVINISHTTFKNSGSVYCLANDFVQLEQNEFSRSTADMDNPGLFLSNPDNPDLHIRVINNTFVNWGTAVSLPQLWSGSTLTMINNIFYFNDSEFDNSGTLAFDNGAIGIHVNGSILNYNVVNGYENQGFQDIDNGALHPIISDDPLFVNESAGDYSLSSGSPAIDAGNPDEQYNDPDGTVGDIGAYYYDHIPQAPVLSLSIYNDHPKLTWTTGADADISHYTIYKYYYVSKFDRRTEYITNYTDTSYIDDGFTAPLGTSTASYKVKAIDNVNQESVWSNTETTKGMANLSRPVVEQLPDEFMLQPAYPNPFNPSTTLSYSLPVTSNVNVMIFDLQGCVVFQELSVSQQAGYYELTWGGKDLHGRALSGGIYLVRFQANALEDREGYDGSMSYNQIRKVTLIK